MQKLVETCLIVAGVGCLTYWGGYQAWAETQRVTQIAAFTSSTGAPDQSHWSEKRVEAYSRAIQEQSDLPISLLRIPSGTQVPVYDGTNEMNLDRGVGRVEGTALPDEVGNLAIAGHRDGFFRSLQDVAVGDQLELITANGNVVYQVVDFAVIEPTDVSVLHPTSKRTLTLITCYPFYFLGDAPQRFVVQAVALDS